MRRLAALLLLTAPALLAASAPVAPQQPTADAALAEAQAEARAATKRLAELEGQAAKAKSEADRLKADQAAAAAAIEESEARIGAADASLRLARAQAALAEQRLATRRAPLAALLAGLATMGRQPPLLTLADHGSVEELVRVKALLDTTMPVIEQRSAALKIELGERQKLAAAANAARADLAKGRDELARRQQRFAELEAKAADRASQLAGEALGAGDRVLASGETLSSAGAEAASRRAAQRNAGEVSQPRAAALQGLDKMRSNLALGLSQGIFVPHPRPNRAWLNDLGATIETAEPVLAANAMSASAMWAANAATVSPAPIQATANAT